MNTIQTDDNKKPGLVTFSNENTNCNENKAAMINATSMAKPFGKKPADWLRLSSTKQFFTALAEVKSTPVNELKRRVKTNSNDGFEKGIWIHEDAALEFARWLSSAFAIWNNERTKELLITGKTETGQTEQQLSVVASYLRSKVEQIENAMSVQARKAAYHDAVLQSRTLIPATVIAKELGLSAVALNKLLHERKIIYKNDTHWVLYSNYQGKGYTGTKTALYIDSGGKYHSNIHTYWTEKGREFIHQMVKETKQIA